MSTAVPRVAIAGAPVSFGVFELTPEGAETLEADQIVDTLADAGYSGIDLGPLGFLGRGAELRARLARRGLELAGGWVQLPFTDDEALAASLAELDEALRAFAEATADGATRMPLPTLADAGSPARAAAPGRGAEVDPLDDAGRTRLARNLDRAAAHVRAAGFEPTFHHHAGTFVESPDEIDRLLDAVDVGLTLDTGHLALAGGEPLDAVRRWGDRITHLHVKDVDTAVLDRVTRAGGGMREVWSSGAFVALGEGDLELERPVRELLDRGYDGWIVVEQDVLPAASTDLGVFLAERARDQRTSRAALEAWVG